MASQDAIYPGSFDPPTRGHLDIIERGARIFERVIVAIIDNPNKSGHFSLQERVHLVKKTLAHLDNVTVDSFSGLLVEYLKRKQATTVLRGLRQGLDLDSEAQMARLNQEMMPAMDTVFLASRPEHIHISSTFVREIAKLGGDFAFLIPPAIYADVLQKYPRKA
jgi:pantetheine-phosphate adenylyltransferase